MLKKTITYKALDGSARKGDFYFHLSKAKLAEMALVHGEDYEDRLKEMIETKNAQEVINLFKDLIRDSYGERDKDGIHFIQSPEVSARFEQTDAWSELFVELVTDAEAGAAFFNGVMPAEIAERMKTGDKIVTTDLPEESPVVVGEPYTGEQPDSSVDAPNSPDDETNEEKYDRLLSDPEWEPSRQDLTLMTQNQMREAFGRKMRQG